MPVPLKFVDQKNTAADLKNSVKNWERKIEIAEVAGRKARVILRQSGEQVEEIVRPDFLMRGATINANGEVVMMGALGSDGEQMDDDHNDYEN